MSDFFRLSRPETGELLELRGRTFILGRSSECDLQVSAKEASRRHLALEIDRGTLYVEDLHSANGTFVNGHRCRSRHALKPRDVLGIAGVEYMVLGPGESENRTMIRYDTADAEDSYVMDDNDGDLTAIVGRYPLPPDWPAEVEREIPESSLRGMERELDRRLIRERLMDGALHAAFWNRKTDREEEQLLKVVPSSSQRWNIGRDPRCDLVLSDFSVSQLHARLELTRSGWQISDLNSSNGTTVNGRRVKTSSALVTGDVVGLSGIELIFRSLLKK